MLPTPSQTIGPFFHHRLEGIVTADVVPPGSAGSVVVRGRVLDGEGAPVSDAMVELWQAGPDGSFPEHDGEGFTGFGRCLGDRDGWYAFTTVKPGRVDADQAPHLDLSVYARGLLQRVVTRIYFPDEVAANADDPVLSAIDERRRATLVAEPDGEGLRFDVHLSGEGETVFFVW